MNKRYWLRGGIVALIIYGVVTLVLVPFGAGVVWPFPYWYLPTLLPLSTFWVFRFALDSASGGDQFEIIIPLVFYFLIGAIIGWLYGKIKNRNKIV